MNISQPLSSTVTSISFSFLSTEDIRKLSVKSIVNPVLLDDLNRPNIGGLYDPALGPSNSFDICATCRLDSFSCPGHYGHIELPSPVYHPLFMTNMFNVLRGTCMFCHHFKLGKSVLCKLNAKLRLIEHGLLVAAMEIDDVSLKEGGKDHDEELADAETLEEFELRIHKYAKAQLQRASCSKRDDYKDNLVFQARKDAIADFMRAIVARKRCANCNAHGYTFRKEGHTKVIEYDLSVKAKKEHQAMGISRPSVFGGSRNDVQDMDDDEGSDSEGGNDQAGGAVLADMMDVDETIHQLPKSASGKVKTKRGRNERLVSPEECRIHLRKLFRNEKKTTSLIFGRHGPFAHLNRKGYSDVDADIFFMEVIPVTPTRFRPPAKMGEMMFEHPQNELLGKILQTSYLLRDTNTSIQAASQKGSDTTPAGRDKLVSSFLSHLITLQHDVNSFLDSSKNPAPMRQGKLPPSGVKQLLEKKEGLFRKNMMGKRVNYAARSVISPDVNIETNEIGIPPVFARKLTFPEPVTPHNVHVLRELVIAGPKTYPGASMVEYEDGTLQTLDNISLEQRTAIANQLLTPTQAVGSSRSGLHLRSVACNKKVHRHLQDGDVVILNRQPTLHKPSMMVHRAKVLLGEKTIRMHYANCNSYNADFDGDEMNIHFPQNQVARAEAMMIANTDNQYLVPTSGKPLRGLIQDHVVAGVWMTSQDSFFTREEYFQLIYGALRPEESSGRLVTLPPAIWKPQPLWTGKQIMSTILKNITPDRFLGINTVSGAKVPRTLWGSDSKEDEVLFMEGELMSGVLDKAAFGASDYGIVHSVYELYGADVAGKLLGILSRLFTKYLQHRAFTCRMDDLVLTPEGDAQRSYIIQNGANLGTQGTYENFPSLENIPTSEKPAALKRLLQEVLRDDSKMAGLDVTVKSKLADLTKSIADATVPHNLLRKFPHNHMQTMTLSGAKGSAVNARQISCALGQQELEGRRVPVMVSGKTLPSFRPFETKAIAGGYVASRFLTGVKPQEFYFHCMAGREGLIDTAVKTSRSGYLQRCLIKHLEGLRVHYDNTVRGSDQSIYQFLYGGDALDVTRQKHLYQFEFLARNEISLQRGYNGKALTGRVEDTIAVDYMKKVLKRSIVRSDKNTPAKREKYDTPMSLFSPQRHLGATSEKFAEKVQGYIAKNEHNLLKVKGGNTLPDNQTLDLIPSARFQLLMNIKYMRSIVDPGEAVGLLASQGVGEPSTQMTLNTFHFAGHGAANVTLGIPRLREIVMTASTKPKTPSMTMPFRQDPKDVADSDIATFCKKASRLTLSQLVDRIVVRESLVKNGSSRCREYTVDLPFFPPDEYQQEHEVRPAEILAALSTTFALLLTKEVKTEMKKLDADIKGQIADVGKGRRAPAGEAGNAGGEDDDEADESRANGGRRDEGIDAGDGDAEDEKRARQGRQQATYESDDEEGAPDEYDEKQAVEAAFADADDDEMSVDEDAAQVKSNVDLERLVASARDNFITLFNFATEFEFKEDGCKFKLELAADMPKLLLVGIIERACLKTVVREIAGITDCFLGKDEKQVPLITTNGSSFKGIWNFVARSEENIIDVDRLESNDIYAVLCAYGVEAARRCILTQIASVFGVYKIDVDSRHLELISDYMTFDGGYKPFNRKGISTHSSPLLKASFETTAGFISDAALYGDFDDLTSPSGNIVLGRPNQTGTGAFDVITAVS